MDCSTLKFGAYELNVGRYELSRAGRTVKIERIPMELLFLLVEKPGELVTRDEIVTKLWGKDVFVDADTSINTAVLKLRRAFKDDPRDPKFIKTLTGNGYRFIAQVTAIPGKNGAMPGVAPDVLPARAPEPIEGFAPPPISATATKPRTWALFVLGLVLLTGALWLFLSGRLAVSKAAGIHSLAVLSFRPMSAEQRDEFLEYGMADALISHLSATGHFLVRPTSSVRKSAIERWDAVEAGRRLGVDAVIEGSVQKLDNALRVTARMLRVKDGAVLWSGSIDDAFPNLFAVQDSLARQIMTALSVKLTPAEQKQLTKHPTTDVEAYEWYQKGRFFAEHRNADGFEKAIGYYQRAIAKDPHDALAWSGLSDAYMLTAWYNTRSPSSAHALAKEAALRSVSLDDTLAEAHTSMAVVFENADWSFQAADREFRRALEIDPNHVAAQHWYGEFLGMMGHPADALAHLHRAQQLDPVSPIIGADTAKALIDARKYGEAIEQCRRTLDLDPTFLPARGWLQNAYVWNGMYRDGQVQTSQLESTKEPLYSLQDWAIFYALSGRPEKADGFSRKFHQMAIGKKVPAFRWAIMYLMAEPNKDKAFEWLNKAYDERDAYLLSLKVAPDFDSVRSDPRYADLVQRMGFLQ